MHTIKTILTASALALIALGCSTNQDSQNMSDGMHNGTNSMYTGTNYSSGSAANHQGPRTPADGTSTNNP